MGRDDLSVAISRLKAAFPDRLQPPDMNTLDRLVELIPDLPIEVRMLYQEVGGVSLPHGPVHLMPVMEVADTVARFRKMGVDDFRDADVSRYGDGRDMILLFSDLGSNYWGLHLKPPYAPRGFVLNHGK